MNDSKLFYQFDLKNILFIIFVFYHCAYIHNHHVSATESNKGIESNISNIIVRTKCFNNVLTEYNLH